MLYTLEQLKKFITQSVTKQHSVVTSLVIFSVASVIDGYGMKSVLCVGWGRYQCEGVVLCSDRFLDCK